MIYGNKVGGITPEKTYIITHGNVELDAVVVDEITTFDAKCEDVTAGKTVVSDSGVVIGTNDFPRCRNLTGVHEIHPNVNVVLFLDEYDMWDYSCLQGYISTKKEPYKVLMLVMDNAVYQNGIKISDISKDKINKTIRFNITNNSEDIYLLHYFICKDYNSDLLPVDVPYVITNLVGKIGDFEYDVMTHSNEGYVYCNNRHFKYGERAILLTGDASRTETTYMLKQRNVGYVKPHLIPSHKYYARVEAYQETKAGTVDIYWPINEPSLLSGLSGPAGQWNMLSAIVDRSSFTEGDYEVRVDYNNQNSTAYMWFDGLMIVDLTDIFGAGKEPDKEWCDNNIPFTTSEVVVKRSENVLQPWTRKVEEK